MKKPVLYLALLFCLINTVNILYGSPKSYANYKNSSGFDSSVLNTSNIDNLYITGKVWGYVKYYHPNITEDNINIDYELFELLPKIIDVDKNTRNKILYEWIKGLGQCEITPTYINEEPNSQDFAISYNDSWTKQIDVLGIELSKQLTCIKYSNRTENYYAQFSSSSNPDFSNEKVYSDVIDYDYGYRLLSVFRFWNAGEFYYPYKDQYNWDNVLKKYIVEAYEPEYCDYRFVESRLISEICDSHASINNDFIFGPYIIPVSCNFLEEKLLVLYDYIITPYGKINESTGLLKAGDEIVLVDDKTINTTLELVKKYKSNSNEAMFLKSASQAAMRSFSQNPMLKIKRNDSCFTITTEAKKLEMYARAGYDIDVKMGGYTLLNDSTGYIHCEKFDIKYYYQIIKDLKKTKRIIFDMRCYPNMELFTFIENYLFDKPTECVLFYKPFSMMPGYFYKETLSIGNSYGEKYKGDIIILVNEETISRAEYFTMILQAKKKSITIGSPTAGTNGNVSYIFLPNGRRTALTAVGVFYPNREPVQKVGVHIDYNIINNYKSILTGTDLILETSLQL